MSDIVVSDNVGMERYEGHVDGRLAGFAEYVVIGDLVVFTHTEVDAAYEGKGVAAAVVRHALDAVRAEGVRRVVARCSFVRAWIDKHPDYADLVHRP